MSPIGHVAQRADMGDKKKTKIKITDAGTDIEAEVEAEAGTSIGNVDTGTKI